MNHKKHTLHLFTCGNRIPKELWHRLGQHITQQEDLLLNHYHNEKYTNYEIFNELLKSQNRFKARDFICIIWNNQKLVNGITFNNNIPTIKSNDDLNKIEFSDYFSFVKDKQKFFHEESHLLHNLISSYLSSLNKNHIYILEIFTNDVKYIPFTNVVDFDEELNLYEYLYNSNIMKFNDIDEEKFVNHLGSLIHNQYKSQKY
jgi:hypothetical protein